MVAADATVTAIAYVDVVACSAATAPVVNFVEPATTPSPRLNEPIPDQSAALCPGRIKANADADYLGGATRFANDTVALHTHERCPIPTSAAILVDSAAAAASLVELLAAPVCSELNAAAPAAAADGLATAAVQAKQPLSAAKSPLPAAHTDSTKLTAAARPPLTRSELGCASLHDLVRPAPTRPGDQVRRPVAQRLLHQHVVVIEHLYPAAAAVTTAAIRSEVVSGAALADSTSASRSDSLVGARSEPADYRAQSTGLVYPRPGHRECA